MASATNERQIAARKARLRADRRVDEVVIQSLMSHPDGRNWIWRQLAAAQVFVEDESLDFATMAYRKGIRNAGLRLLKDVQRFSPREYIIMTEEATSIELKEIENDDGNDD